MTISGKLLDPNMLKKFGNSQYYTSTGESFDKLLTRAAVFWPPDAHQYFVIFNNLVILCSQERLSSILHFRHTWIATGEMFGEINVVIPKKENEYQTPSGSIYLLRQDVYNKIAKNAYAWPVIYHTDFSFT